jgi:hypothetical protein
MPATRAPGTRDAVILNYADSGDVSGDKSAVVGYLAAALGTFVKGQTPYEVSDPLQALQS